jgi:phage tail-like protein
MARVPKRLDARFALIRGADQWQRASFHDAALVDGIVQLGWVVPEGADDVGSPASAAGLAFDAHCRLYHSVPEQGNIERILWSAQDPLRPRQSPEPLALFAAGATPIIGDFTSVAAAGTALNLPRALAVDGDERLFIAEAGARQVLVFDLWSQRLLRRVSVPGEPVDLFFDGEWVYVLLAKPAALLRMRAQGTPLRRELAATITQPSRLTGWHDGRLLVLNAAGTAGAQVVDAADGSVLVAPSLAAFASDIETQTPNPAATPILVIARRGGEDFLRAELDGNSAAFIAPLTARAYDGRGIVRTPDERIAYWTAKGLRYAVAARVRYAAEGRVVGFRLDSGEYQMQWGRLCIDACIPRDSEVTVRCIASDEPPDAGLIARMPPVNVTSLAIEHDDLSPPLPAQWMIDAVRDEQSLYRRPHGAELPWLTRAIDDDFATYEAPVIAGPGRYLWIVFELRGNSIVTPRIRSVRAEFPGHDYLRRLPRTFSTEPESASFLRRYLAMFGGQLQEMSNRAEHRDILLNPDATAAEALPWLASCLGLTLDERWSVESRRRAIAEAIELWKRRGTIRGLSRFIEIVAGVRPIILEKYRMRGGGMVGNPDALASTAILGAGFRVGGAVGVAGETPLTEEVDDAFETHAHRFTVLLPGTLDESGMSMLEDLLELHRPAHTLFEMCSIGAGMRVGRGLHVGISSAIGRGGGFAPLQIGNSALGRGAIVGRPRIGIRPGATRLPGSFGSGDSRVG